MNKLYLTILLHHNIHSMTNRFGRSYSFTRTMTGLCSQTFAWKQGFRVTIIFYNVTSVSFNCIYVLHAPFDI